MTTIQHPFKHTRDFNVWQLSARLGFLAAVLMAYSYCFLLTIKIILNWVH
jgi:hypothetical protein